MSKVALKWIGLLVLPTLSFLLVFLASEPHGLGLAADSVDYFFGAKNILNKGLFLNQDGVFINHYPPLYSYVSVGFSKLIGLSLTHSFSVVNALSFGLSIFLCWLILTSLTNHSWLALLGSFLVLSSSYNEIYAWTLTEGFFCLMVWIQLYLMLHFLHKPNPNWLFVVLGTLSGLMLLTRFAGIPFVFMGVLYTWINPNINKKPLKTIVYALTFFVVISIWLLHTHKLGISPANRSLAFHPPSILAFVGLLSRLLLWFSPYNKVSLLVILALFFLLAIKRKEVKGILSFSKGPVTVLFSGVILYGGFIVASRTLFDAHIQFDQRIFAPLFPYVLISFFVSIKPLTLIYKTHSTVVLMVLLFLIGLSGFESAQKWILLYKEGVGYTSKRWKESDLITTAKSSPTIVYSNFSKQVSLLLDKKEVRGLPVKYNSTTTKPFSGFHSSLERVIKEVQNQKACMVLLDNKSRGFAVGIEDIKTYQPLVQIDHFKDGYLVTAK